MPDRTGGSRGHWEGFGIGKERWKAGEELGKNGECETRENWKRGGDEEVGERRAEEDGGRLLKSGNGKED
jgi:hypothetical protein